MNTNLNELELNKVKVKEALRKVLIPYFGSKDFNIYSDGPSLIFVNIQNDKVIHFFFRFLSDCSIGLGPFDLTFYEVEDYILQVGIPSNKLVEQAKKEKYHLPTIALRTYPKTLHSKPMKTENDIVTYAKSFIEFYEDEGLTFVSNHSGISALHLALIELEKEGRKLKELVCGMGSAFIRVLIISKLCNDRYYAEKFSKINLLFQDSEEWQPYWEKYKIVLEGIEPKYNLKDT